MFVLSLISNNSTWPIDRTLSGATTPGQSGPGSDGNERVLQRALQSSSIPGVSLTIRLFNVISRSLIVLFFLPLYRDAVDVFYSPSRLGSSGMNSEFPSRLAATPRFKSLIYLTIYPYFPDLIIGHCVHLLWW